jgi:chemotaxis protein methyltransferase CheR
MPLPTRGIAINTPAGEKACTDDFSARNFHSGIKMPPGRRTMLVARLRSRLIALEIGSLDAYCAYVFEGGGHDQEIVALINAVSTNKTDFFRESAHFDFLRDMALPALMKAGQRHLKAWSAASSIGAEAYSLAMVLEEFRRTRQGPDYSILATDISTEVLRTAVTGQFTKAMIGAIPPELRRRYVLQPCDPSRDRARITPRLRAKIAWGRMNLIDDQYPVGTDMDVIFCRNVLIYFDRPAQTHVVARLSRHLRPGGYLILGHSESAAGADVPLARITSTIFQKV